MEWEMKKVLAIAGIVFLFVVALSLLLRVNSSLEPRPKPQPISFGHHEIYDNTKYLEWLMDRHRTEPGIDWRDVERTNWENNLLKRNTRVDKGFRALWKEVGPVNQSGRSYDTDISSDGKYLYVGSVRGGIWRAEVNPDNPNFQNLSWQPLSDHVYGGAYQLLALNQGSLVIGQQRVHFSSDQGQTWQPSNGESFNQLWFIRRLIKVKNSIETIFATGVKWHWNGDDWVVANFLFRSDDYGASFREIKVLGTYSVDIWTSRVGEGPLYTVRENYFEKSMDLGESWVSLGQLPINTQREAILAGSEAGAPTFYIATRSEENSWYLYRSDDEGINWIGLGFLEGGIWLDSMRSLEVSPTYPNLVLYGNLNAYRSNDGGASFRKINEWWEYYGNEANKLHADLPGFDFITFPDGTERLFISTDGGTYISEDKGLTVENISLAKLNTSQFYDILTDRDNFNKILGGTQDQGYQYGQVKNNSQTPFSQLISGDYGHLVSGDGTHSIVYSVYPGSVLISDKDDSGNLRCCYGAEFPEDPNLDWMPFLMADLDDNEIFYLGGSQSYKYQRNQSNWNYTALPYNFVASEGERVSAMAMAPSDTNRWYAVSSLGRFWVSFDRGMNWEERADNLPLPSYIYGSFIWVSPANPDIVVMAGSGYSNPGVWLSSDGGSEFNAMGANQPRTLFLEITPYPSGPDDHLVGDFYAATESGPYHYDSKQEIWKSILKGRAPSTTYHSVETLGDFVRFGTHGRGIWDYKPPPCENFSILYENIPNWPSKSVLDLILLTCPQD